MGESCALAKEQHMIPRGVNRRSSHHHQKIQEKSQSVVYLMVDTSESGFGPSLWQYGRLPIESG